MQRLNATPQAAVKRIWSAASPLDRRTFLWAFFGGLLIHLYRLTNFSMVPETPYFFYAQDNRADHGRWLLHYISDWTGWLDIQWLTGVVSLLYLSAACVLLVRALKIQSPATGAFAALLFMANPATAVLLHFSYTADAYAFAILLSSLAVFCTDQLADRGGRMAALGTALGAVLLCLSLAIYQSNLSLAAFLCIAILVRAVFE